jgi:hypothetical protein
MYLNISCPISENRVNGNAARIIAFIVTIILGIGIVSKSVVIILLLGVDFAVRSFTSGEYSPVKFFAGKVIGILKIKYKPIEAEPKKFSAGLGFIFSIAIASSLFANDLILAYIISGLLATCALLEGAFDFCVGCYVYSFIIPFYKLKHLRN